MRTVSEFYSLAVFELKGGFIMEKMVIVKNMIDSKVGFVYGAYKYRWEKRGQKLPIPFEVLHQALYLDAIRNMFTQGMLYIDNMDDKKELGLESQDATKPENIIALSELEVKELLTVKPIDVFKHTIATLPDAQIDNVIDYAITNNIVEYEKCAILKQITGRDIMTAIQRKAQIAEEERRDKEIQAARAAEGRRI